MDTRYASNAVEASAAQQSLMSTLDNSMEETAARLSSALENFRALDNRLFGTGPETVGHKPESVPVGAAANLVRTSERLHVLAVDLLSMSHLLASRI